MLNHIWAAMLVFGFVYGIVAGNLPIITNSILEAAKEAVNLSITLLGIVAFWCGIMEIAQDAGLIDALSRRMRPIIHFLFPNIPEEHGALKAISVNFIANVLGLGWAATPAGLKAMEELAKLEEERRKEEKDICIKKKSNCMPLGIASNEMCTFLILNISSLQLIPVNIIAYRTQYGSASPASIVGFAMVATAASTGAAIVFCKLIGGKSLKFH